MAAKTTFGWRLNAAMLDLAKRRGERVTNREVGDAIGLTGEAIGAYLRDGVDTHSIENVAQLAAFLGVCPAWLAWGTEPMRPAEGEDCDESEADGASTGRRAPVKLAGPAIGRRKQG